MDNQFSIESLSYEKKDSKKKHPHHAHASGKSVEAWETESVAATAVAKSMCW